MPAQPRPEAFAEARVKTDPLAEMLCSLTNEIEANVAFAQSNPRVAMFLFVSVPRQGERFLRHF